MSVGSKVRFYLSHREKIDEWASLRGAAIAESNKFFGTVEAAVRRMAKGKDSCFVQAESGDGRTLYLYREPWLGTNGVPRLSVALYFDSGKIFDGFGAGVFVYADLDPQRILRDAFNAEIKRSTTTVDGFTNVHRWWCLWSDQRVQADYFDHLDKFCDQLVDTLAQYWTTFSPLIENIFQAIP